MRIRELRERRGLTGTELARMTGVTLPAVIGWENGSKTPTTDKLADHRGRAGVRDRRPLRRRDASRGRARRRGPAVAAKGAADARALAAGK